MRSSRSHWHTLKFDPPFSGHTFVDRVSLFDHHRRNVQDYPCLVVGLLVMNDYKTQVWQGRWWRVTCDHLQVDRTALIS